MSLFLFLITSMRLFTLLQSWQFNLWTRHRPPLERGNEGLKKDITNAHAIPEPLPPEWSRIQVLCSPRKRPPIQKKQHRLPPDLVQNHHPLPPDRQRPIHHIHTNKLIYVVSVWRICRWMTVHFHVWHAAEKQRIPIAKTISLEAVWVKNRKINALIAK